MPVYLVQAGAGGPVKIGSAKNVAHRIAAIQTAAPAPLRVLAVFAGGRPEEWALHARLAPHRLHGEWFAPHPDVLGCGADLQPIEYWAAPRRLPQRALPREPAAAIGSDEHRRKISAGIKRTRIRDAQNSARRAAIEIFAACAVGDEDSARACMGWGAIELERLRGLGADKNDPVAAFLAGSRTLRVFPCSPEQSHPAPRAWGGGGVHSQPAASSYFQNHAPSFHAQTMEEDR